MSNRRSPPSQYRRRGLACSRFFSAAATSQPRGWLDMHREIPPARVADTRSTGPGQGWREFSFLTSHMSVDILWFSFLPMEVTQPSEGAVGD